MPICIQFTKFLKKKMDTVDIYEDSSVTLMSYALTTWQGTTV